MHLFVTRIGMDLVELRNIGRFFLFPVMLFNDQQNHFLSMTRLFFFFSLNEKIIFCFQHGLCASSFQVNRFIFSASIRYFLTLKFKKNKKQV